MDEVIYGIGVISTVILGGLGIKYINNKLEVNLRKDVATILALSRTTPITQLIKTKWKNARDYNNNIFRILNLLIDPTYNGLDNYRYKSFCKGFIKDAKLVLSSHFKTSQGKTELIDALDSYKKDLSKDLRSLRLTSLKIEQNKLKYSETLEKIIKNSKGVSSQEFRDSILLELGLSSVEFEQLWDNLTDQDSGVIFESEGTVYFSMNTYNLISDLDKRIYRTSNELNILESIDLEESLV